MPQIWLVTGSNRGLGRSIAEAALSAGHHVVATARDTASLEGLQCHHGDRLRLFALDVTDPAAAVAAVRFAVEAFGRLDVLVNNAGFGHVSPFEQTTPENFRAQIDTNFYGVVNLTYAALPVMRAQRSGTIINISSVGGRVGTPGLSAYQAAKWAVGGFTEVLALETAPFGVKVIAVEPGGIRTGWAATAGEKSSDLLAEYEPSVGAVQTMLKAYAGNEHGDPEKIATVIIGLPVRDRLPTHLLLGATALHVFGLAEAQREKDAAEWAEVSAATDFDGMDLSFLTGETQS